MATKIIGRMMHYQYLAPAVRDGITCLRRFAVCVHGYGVMEYLPISLEGAKMVRGRMDISWWQWENIHELAAMEFRPVKAIVAGQEMTLDDFWQGVVSISEGEKKWN